MILPPVDERDGPMIRNPYEALEREIPRRSTIAATAILATILIGAPGLALCSILVGAPAGASAIGVAR